VCGGALRVCAGVFELAEELEEEELEEGERDVSFFLKSPSQFSLSLSLSRVSKVRGWLGL